MKYKMREIPHPTDGRVETGIVQFDGDWPGVWIRGDNALAWAGELKAILMVPDHKWGRKSLERMIELLESCHAKNHFEPK